MTALAPSVHPATLEAAKHLISYLEDAAELMRYRPNGAKIQEIVDEEGIHGHFVSLNQPANGFSETQIERIRSYSEGLTYWDKLITEFESAGKQFLVRFIGVLEREDEEANERKTLRDRIADFLTPPEFVACKSLGKFLVDQGFKVREPAPATVVMKTKQYHGFALLVKYPISRSRDQAGITQVYDKYLPFLADAHGRSLQMKSEVQISDDTAQIFFTNNRHYVSSLFETFPEFRVIVPRPKANGLFELGSLLQPTYRACKTLMSKYKNDFLMLKRPQKSWSGSGHLVVMHYKKGAAGRLVDDSYTLAIRKMVEKLMKQHSLVATIQIRPETRSLIVTFQERTDARQVGSHAAVYVAVDGSGERLESHATDKTTPVP